LSQDETSSGRRTPEVDQRSWPPAQALHGSAPRPARAPRDGRWLVRPLGV